jgi:hypothetical protein
VISPLIFFFFDLCARADGESGDDVFLSLSVSLFRFFFFFFGFVSWGGRFNSMFSPPKVDWYPHQAKKKKRSLVTPPAPTSPFFLL